MLAPLHQEPARNHIRSSLSPGDNFNSLLEEKKGKAKKYITNRRISPTEVMKKLPDLIKDDFEVDEDTVNKTYTISKAKKSWAFSLPLERKRRESELARAKTPRKETIDKLARAFSATVQGEKDEDPSIVFRLRSVDGMIYFLGEIVRLQLSEKPLPPIKTSRIAKFSYLFKVDINAGRELGDRVEVEFLGERFAIPRKVRENDQVRDRTLTTFALVSQLFSLYRESSDLPKTSAVQVIGSQ
jgi:hypothetical protein